MKALQRSLPIFAAVALLASFSETAKAKDFDLTIMFTDCMAKNWPPSLALPKEKEIETDTIANTCKEKAGLKDWSDIDWNVFLEEFPCRTRLTGFCPKPDA